MRCLAEEGYDLAISYVSKKEEADKVVEQISETYHTRCFAYQAALQEKGAGKALFDRAVADLGGLDLLVNNAGLTIFESLQNIQEETLDLLINLDFKNYILMMRKLPTIDCQRNQRETLSILHPRAADSLIGGWPVRQSEGWMNRTICSLRWMCLNTEYASTTSRRARFASEREN